MIKYLNVLTDGYTATNIPVTLTIDNEEVITFDIQWDGASYQQGTRPLGDDMINLNRAIVKHVNHSLCVLSLRHPFPCFDAQTIVSEGLTTSQILSLALSNLYEVSVQIDSLKGVLPMMKGFTFWHNLYRIATCSINAQSTELEIASVRALQSLVMLKTVTDAEDDEVLELTREQLNKNVRSLLNWR